MAWQDQGRQGHGWFGHGSGPGATDAHEAIRGRMTSVAYGAIAALGSTRRRYFEQSLHHGGLDDLRDSAPAWAANAHLSADAFHSKVLGGSVGAGLSSKLQDVARAANGARTSTDLATAAQLLADAVAAETVDRWPRQLAAARSATKEAVESGLIHPGPVQANQSGSLLLASGSGATVPPPESIPGGPWKWSADTLNRRGGKFLGSNGASASWDPVDGHWDVDDGQDKRTRFNRFGAPLTPDKAHGPYKGPPRLPLPLRLFRMIPPLFIFPEQERQILGMPDAT